MLELPKHPLERKTTCPVCGVEYQTVPIRRAASPDDPSIIVEQHTCPKGHVYVTEIGTDRMLKEW